MTMENDHPLQENAPRRPRRERKRFQPFLSYRMGPDTKHLDVLDGVRTELFKQ